MTGLSAIDKDDRTPQRVINGISRNAARYPFPKDACIPCGAIIHMGFFFDGFGRNRDLDDPASSRYSNICRLWEAHRDNTDDRRIDMPNEFWYRFYYSGLGTPLNEEARTGAVISAATKIRKKGASAATSASIAAAAKITGADRIIGLPQASATAASKALKEAFTELSYRPVIRAYGDLVNQLKKAPAQLGRVMTIASEDRWVRRGKAATRGFLYDIKKNPLKAGWSAAKAVFTDIGLDTIPLFRDSAAVALVMGTGVEDRLMSALQQFESAYTDARAKMPNAKVQRIHVSVFGADRGAVIARAFVNELARRYQREHAEDLAIDGFPIKIDFLGLLDAVSSLMKESKLLGLLPVVGMIRQNYGEQPLGVPPSVRVCKHFVAAHELRFYQRLDSLENTRGEQYLYPGTSEDITGGAPPGQLGFRAELQRVALRDMLHEALMAGAMMDSMEDLKIFKPDTFTKFSLAHTLSNGTANYRIRELMAAYRKLVPLSQGLNFADHMKIFLQWLAIRYQSPGFRESLAGPTKQLKEAQRARTQRVQEAQTALETERRRSPFNQQTYGKAVAELQSAQTAEAVGLRETIYEVNRPSISVWDRLDNESTEMLQRWRNSKLEVEAREQKNATAFGHTQAYTPVTLALTGAYTSEATPTDEEITLVKAWEEGASGKKPLPPEVMALFDLMVHDTMLTSWHDHVLSSTLYFQTRQTDAFGNTDDKEEALQRQRDELHARQSKFIEQFQVPLLEPTLKLTR